MFNDTTIEYSGMRKFIDKYIDFLQAKLDIKIDFQITRPKDNQTFISVNRKIGIPLISKQTAKSVSFVKRMMKKYNVSYETIMQHSEPTIENVEILKSLFGGLKSIPLYILGYTSSINKFDSEYRIAKKWLPLINAPFEISDKCCEILKHGNIPAKFKDYAMMTAEMAEESRSRLASYLQTGCNDALKHGGNKSKPMGPMTLQTVLRNIKENNIPLFSGYGEIVEENGIYRTTGMYRTGCALCGFGLDFIPNRFVELYKTEPARVKFAFKPRSEGGLGYKEALEYCNKYCGTSFGIPDIED